jgi:phage gp45-like
MIAALRVLEARLRTLIFGLVRRGEVTLCNDEYGLQLAGYAGEEGEDEQFDNVELWQQYGLASRPPEDAEVLTANLMGLGENAVAFATNSAADRPSDLVAGEVVTHGKKILTGQAQARHKPDGTLSLVAATGKFVEVGGNAELLLKGDTVVSAMDAFCTTLGGAIDPAVLGAAATLQAALASWKASKGKVA